MEEQHHMHTLPLKKRVHLLAYFNFIWQENMAVQVLKRTFTYQGCDNSLDPTQNDMQPELR